MTLLNASLRAELQKVFAATPRPVTLLVFVRSACRACDEARTLVEELASIASKIHVEVHDLDTRPQEATLYRIEKAPAIVVLGGESGRRDFGIRFYGSLAGYEFATLIEDICMASAESQTYRRPPSIHSRISPPPSICRSS